MSPEDQAGMRQLCKAIVEERDQQKFIELVQALRQLLDRHKDDLERKANRPPYWA